MEYNNYLCQCEHLESEHNQDFDSSIFFATCNVLVSHRDSPTVRNRYCKCKKYKRDNLRYLESLVGKHGTI